MDSPAPPPGGRSAPAIGRAAVLVPVLAWLAVAVIAFLYFNRRGYWKIESGTEAYRACFGARPPAGLKVQRSEAHRHYRYTGELLALECYVRGEGAFDTAAADWRAAPRAAGGRALDSLLDAEGLRHAPDWFVLPRGRSDARILRSRGGAMVSLYPVGNGGILIAGGGPTREGRR